MDQEVLIKADADEVPVITSTVTDAELDAAAAGKTVEEKPVEEKPVEEKPVEEPKPEKTPAELAAEEEHKERSRLGRKLAKVEEELLEQRKQTNELMELLRTQMTQKPEEEKPNIPEYITTPQELEQYLDYREQNRMKKQQEYHGLYRKTVFDFKSNENAEVHAEILKEMDANFNTIPTGNPVVDAELNYNKAARAYYAKLASAKKVGKEIPLKGGTPEVATGLSGASRVIAKETILPKLDSVAQEYVDYLKSIGKKDEDIKTFIKTTLEGEAPVYIRQG